MLLSNNVAVLTIIVFLTYFNASCLGYHLLPYSNTSLIRDRRQTDCSNAFVCKTGDDCVILNKVCDGIRDCSDGSDETYAECKEVTPEPTSVPPLASGFCPAINLSNGKYEVLGQRYTPGAPISNYALVKLTCNANYALNPDNGLINCLDGNWNVPIPECKLLSPSRTSDFCPAIYLANGKYEVLGQSYTPGEPIPNYAPVKLTCNANFALYPDNDLMNCVDGNWNIPVPECKKTCSPRISSSVDVTCTTGGDGVDCSKPMVEGTVARSTCKRFYTQTHPDAPTSRCTAGSWDKPLVRCEPECGQVVSDGTVYVVNGVSPKKGEFPWHVGIYRYQGGKHNYQNGGVIITPLIILTGAHCFTDNKLGKERYPAQEFYVAAGKYYSDYNAAEDKLAQKIQVKNYYIPPQFRGTETFTAGNLAVVVLMKAFELSNVVQPVCVDWDNKFESQQLKPNNSGSLVGWGYVDPNNKYISEELKQLNAPYIDVGPCLDVVSVSFRRYVTTDKFCAGFTNGSSVCHGDTGGGLVFEWNENNKQKFYIRGLSSGGPGKGGTCNNFQYGVYTKVSAYYNFIRDVINSNSVMDKEEEIPRISSSINVNCPITIENGQYSVLEQSYVSGTPRPSYSLVKLTCNTNYMLFPPIPIIECNNGIWITPIPQCKLACPPRNSSLVNVKCTMDGIPVDCNQPMMEGTVVTSTCKQFYTQSDNDIPISTCIRGSWSNPLVTCKPVCGEVVSKGETFIVNGINVKRGQFPWHIALYRLQKGKHKYQCGGSIINPLIIITAAHCFTDETGVKYPAEEYHVGAGKYYSDYNSPEDKFAQKTQVKEYHIPKQYKGYMANYAGDLAVIVVRTAFQMSNVVQPVCLDWIGHQQQNNRGSVVGWGYVDPNIPNASEELKQLNPLYIDFDQCFDKVPSYFRRWVTLDKFCAGFTNGSSVCKGDSGGGLVFKWNNREKFYIRGVVSAGPVQNGTCDNFQYGVYTKISYYSEFIVDIINKNPIIN